MYDVYSQVDQMTGTGYQAAGLPAVGSYGAIGQDLPTESWWDKVKGWAATAHTSPVAQGIVSAGTFLYAMFFQGYDWKSSLAMAAMAFGAFKVATALLAEGNLGERPWMSIAIFGAGAAYEAGALGRIPVLGEWIGSPAGYANEYDFVVEDW